VVLAVSAAVLYVTVAVIEQITEYSAYLCIWWRKFFGVAFV